MIKAAPTSNATRGAGHTKLKPFRLLIVALNYAPEMVGCAKYTSELAEDMAARGHQVEVVTGPPYYPDWSVGKGYSGARWSTEVRGGVTIHRTPLYVPSKPSGLKRIIHLASFGLAARLTAVKVARRFKPNVVFAVAPTIAAAGAALSAAKASGARSWLHVQDFEVDAAFGLGMLKNQTTRSLALSAERRLLNRFDHVSTISPAMLRGLASKGVPADRIVELRNWADIDATPVFPSSDTNYRKELGLRAEQVVALYSGNMAGKQGIEALADVAVRLRDAKVDVVMLLCGGGPARAQLEVSCAGMDNVRFMPLQPLERLPELLGTADIHLLPQRPEAADLVLPSKLTGMLASGRPVVAMAEDGTGLADEVAGCGIAVAPNADAMAEAIITLVGNPELRRTYGAFARERAEKVWRKSMILDGFEAAASEDIT